MGQDRQDLCLTQILKKNTWWQQRQRATVIGVLFGLGARATMVAPLLDLKIQNHSCATSQIYLGQVFGQNFDFCNLHRGRKVFLMFSNKVHSALWAVLQNLLHKCGHTNHDNHHYYGGGGDGHDGGDGPDHHFRFRLPIYFRWPPQAMLSLTQVYQSDLT